MEASSQDDLREQAKANLKRKRDFRTQVVTFTLISIVLVVIWAISDEGFFWPIFPILGFCIALVTQAWNLYGQKPITESDIDREVNKLQ